MELKVNKLKKFDKNKKKKRIVIASIIGILLVVGGITLYRTFALYEEKLEFNVLKGRIPDFVSGDVQLAMTLDGDGITEIPSDRNYTVTVTCDTEEMSGTWDYENWTVTISGAITKPTKCSIEFNSIFKYYIDEEEVKEKPDKSVYLYKSMTCNKGTASYNENTQEGTVTNYEEGMECSIKYKTPSTTLFSDYLIAKSITDSSIIRQEHEETEQTGSNATIDYRYVGGDIDEENYVHNYVCLEASGSCTEDQLLRIIGVIPTQSSEDGPYVNRVKLISSVTPETVSFMSYGNYVYPADRYNDWVSSPANKTTLNETYWNSISNYHKYIDNTKWYLGGVQSGSTGEYYKLERSSIGGAYRPANTSLVSNIGLMYPSDYGYATNGSAINDRQQCLNASFKAWYDGDVLECDTNDWLFRGVSELLISPHASTNNKSAVVSESGWVGFNETQVFYSNSRPVFHLKSSVRYQNGNGSKENPYTIEIG